METKTLSVPDISCDHCKMSIEGATSVLAGVTDASVDIPGKTVTISYETDAVGLDEIVSAIEEQGYEVAR
ncbi:MAG: heavy-metal-associated domain-containing protein [Acidimicrobiia bacterium]|nr:cation transporter [Acidimicrobiia bacterium]MBT8193655.1 cation transporter [Acidimicrobiia bacterium]MBT8248222.1 cation transporter [Acidimicrobiia bacterium]NNF89467.1 heavy-metal-associated domain-containing protein [Acidimicrobiia bacterium]NNJ46635.1 heavy-metal-associated domain-containing protein [Acidimicrobiia bacterium]